MATEADRLASFHLTAPSRKGASAAKNRILWPHAVADQDAAGTVAARAAPIPTVFARLGFSHSPTSSEPDRVTHHLCAVSLSDWDVKVTDVLLRLETAVRGNKVAEALVRVYKSNWIRQRAGDDEDVWVWNEEDYLPTSKAMVQARKATFGKKFPLDDKKTHKGWIPNSKALAEAGFHCTAFEEEEDSVTCVYCEKALGGWEKEDHPQEEHRRRHPECPFFNCTYEAAQASEPSMQAADDAVEIVSELEEEPPMPPTARRGGRAASKQPAGNAAAREPSVSKAKSATSSRTASRNTRKRVLAEDEQGDDQLPEVEEALATTKSSTRATSKRGKAKAIADEVESQPEPSSKPPTRSISRSKLRSDDLSTDDEDGDTPEAERPVPVSAASQMTKAAKNTRRNAPAPHPVAQVDVDSENDEDDDQDEVVRGDGTVIEYNDESSLSNLSHNQVMPGALVESDFAPLSSTASARSGKSASTKRRRAEDLARALSDPASGRKAGGKKGKKQAEAPVTVETQDSEQLDEGNEVAQVLDEVKAPAPAASAKRRPGRPRKVQPPPEDDVQTNSERADSPPPAPKAKGKAKSKNAKQSAVASSSSIIPGALPAVEHAPASELGETAHEEAQAAATTPVSAEAMHTSKTSEPAPKKGTKKASSKTRAAPKAKTTRVAKSAVEDDGVAAVAVESSSSRNAQAAADDVDAVLVPRRRGRPPKKVAPQVSVRATRSKDRQVELEASASEDEFAEADAMSVDESFAAIPAASTSYVRPVEKPAPHDKTKAKKSRKIPAHVPVVVLDPSFSRSQDRGLSGARPESIHSDEESEEAEEATMPEVAESDKEGGAEQTKELHLSDMEDEDEGMDSDSEPAPSSKHAISSTPPRPVALHNNPADAPAPLQPRLAPNTVPSRGVAHLPQHKHLLDLELTDAEREGTLREFLLAEMEHALGELRHKGENMIREVRGRMKEGRREAERRLRGLA